MKSISFSIRPDKRSQLPVRALVFGDGGKARGLIDWLIFKANKEGVFNGRTLTVTDDVKGAREMPVRRGPAAAAADAQPQGPVCPVELLKKQDCLYTTLLHGRVQGGQLEEAAVINSIASVLNPRDSWEAVMGAAMDAQVKFVFSDTTEAGMVFKSEQPFNTDVCPDTFSGQLCAILFERFKAGAAGLWVIPCESVEDNGSRLRDLVLRHAAEQNCGDSFTAWLDSDCRFVNTCADRIVSGYPEPVDCQYWNQLGYEDFNMVCGQTVHELVLQGGEEILKELPFDQVGLNVKTTADVTPFALRRSRVIDGGMMALAPAGLLSSMENLCDVMADKGLGSYGRSVIKDEVVPVLTTGADLPGAWVDEAIERLADNDLKYALPEVLEHASLKVKEHLIPSLLDARSRGVVPRKLCFALAAWTALYQHAASSCDIEVRCPDGKSVSFKDDSALAGRMQQAWSHYQKSEATARFTVSAVLGDTTLWGCDLSADMDVVSVTACLLHAIISDGVALTVQDLMEHV